MPQNPDAAPPTKIKLGQLLALTLGRGAVIVGNDRLATVAVLDIAGGGGSVKIDASRSAADRGKQVFELELRDVQLELHANSQYRGLRQNGNEHDWRGLSRYVQSVGDGPQNVTAESYA